MFHFPLCLSFTENSLSKSRDPFPFIDPLLYSKHTYKAIFLIDQIKSSH